MSKPLLEVSRLKKHFPIKAGLFKRIVGQIKAVDGVSFVLNEGETLGLVGESGCGKTTTGKLILQLMAETSGTIHFHLNGNRTDLKTIRGRELRRFRRHLQFIFQDPFASLNPRMSVYDIIAEPLRAQQMGTAKEIQTQVEELTEAVGLNVAFLQRYPHAFSGGQRQRIGIARALILNPKLVVCDEPVSALDVSVQAQIINLLKKLQRKLGLTYIFIAHDLAVVENICDRVAVMYAGRIVELAAKQTLFSKPKHPYTEALMSAVPRIEPGSKNKRILLSGEVADPSNLPAGCSFHPRCRFAEPICSKQEPELRDLGDGQLCACHLAEKLTLAGAVYDQN